MGLVKKLLVIIGPTAVGKTSLSLQLAETFDGEIVSADSRLFYRGMDIGTAKPSAVELARIPHHLIDICDPNETITLGEYQKLAYKTIDQIIESGRLPILVGGTGQYVMAIVEGWGIPEVAPYKKLRKKLEALGGQELNLWLTALDPVSAGKIDPRNIRRVIRALEVTLITGRPISKLQRKSPPDYDICIIGLTRKRAELFERIDDRVDLMLANGLLSEVSTLRNMGYNRSLPAISGLGYRQLNAFLDGEMEYEEAVERIKFETHRFARQQNTWFRADDPRINWFDVSIEHTKLQIAEKIRRWMQE